MADTLVYPATGTPTTTITFDGIIDISRGRRAMNSQDFGGSGGTSRQAASLRTQSTMSISFKLITQGGSLVFDKVKALEEMYALYADKDFKISIDHPSGDTAVYVGKITDEDGIFQGGNGAVVYQGTIGMNVATLTWNT